MRITLMISMPSVCCLCSSYQTLDRLASDISVPQFTVMLSETMEAFLKHVTEEEEEVSRERLKHSERQRDTLLLERSDPN